MNGLMKRYVDWFWNFVSVDLDALEVTNPFALTILELLPYVVVASLLVGFFGYFLFRGKEESEELGEDVLTEMDKEIELIREMQSRR